MKILLAGGGTAGPVAPLIAVAKEIKKTHLKAEFLLVGTKQGPESEMAKTSGLPFTAITAGKWRRYFSLKNILTPFQLLVGFWQARKIIKNFKPDCVVGAGSFVQVPVIWAAKFQGIPVVIHQQDVFVSLANRLCEHAAAKITVSFSDSLTEFSSGLGLFYKKNRNKIVLTGNPFRAELKSADKKSALQYFGLTENLPTLLVLGGGTGSEYLNKLILQSLPELTKYVQIVHSTGSSRQEHQNELNYKPYKFINNMGEAYAAADIVLCRGGLSTITELSNLEKVAIVVPMPNSHQEINAYFLFRNRAAIIFDQKELTPENFVRVIRKLLFDSNLQSNLKAGIAKIMPKNSAKKIADIVVKLIETSI